MNLFHVTFKVLWYPMSLKIENRSLGFTPFVQQKNHDIQTLSLFVRLGLVFILLDLALLLCLLSQA